MFQSSIGAAASHKRSSRATRPGLCSFNPRSAPPPVASVRARQANLVAVDVSILDRRRRRSQDFPRGALRRTRRRFNPRSAPPPVASRALSGLERDRYVSILDRRRRRSQASLSLDESHGALVLILDRRRRRSQDKEADQTTRGNLSVSILDRRRRRSRVQSVVSGQRRQLFQSSIGAAAGRARCSGASKLA